MLSLASGSYGTYLLKKLFRHFESSTNQPGESRSETPAVVDDTVVDDTRTTLANV